MAIGIIVCIAIVVGFIGVALFDAFRAESCDCYAECAATYEGDKR